MIARYELGTLEGIISNDIASFIKLNCTVDPILVSDFQKEISAETEKIKNNFAQAPLILRKKKMKKYVQFHQQALVRLAGYLLRYAHPEKINGVSKSPNYVVFCQYLYFSINDLLQFVEKHFAEHVHLDSWVPEGYRRLIVHEISKQIDLIKNGLSEQEIPDEMTDIVLQPFIKFMEQKQPNKITYRKVIYLRKLAKNLLAQVNSGEKEPTALESLRLLLLYLNFNSLEYYNYCTEQIRSYIEAAESMTESIERLALVQKLVYQAEVRGGLGFCMHRKTLKELLCSWIAREMGYLEKRRQLMNSIGETNPAVSPSAYKLNLNASVAQLAYFIRICIELNIIQNQNLSWLLKMLSAISRTKRAEAVSYDSLRLKYYEVERGTQQSVKNLLLKMVDHIPL